MGQFSGPAALLRHPLVTAAATLTLGVGAVFTVMGSNGNKLLECYTGTGCTLQNPTISSIVQTKTNNFTVSSGSFFTVNATNGSVEASLPAASSVSGREYTFKKIDASVNYMILEPNGAETLDGAGSGYTNTQYDSFTITSNGSNWFIK